MVSGSSWGHASRGPWLPISLLHKPLPPRVSQMPFLETWQGQGEKGIQVVRCVLAFRSHFILKARTSSVVIPYISYNETQNPCCGQMPCEVTSCGLLLVLLPPTSQLSVWLIYSFCAVLSASLSQFPSLSVIPPGKPLRASGRSLLVSKPKLQGEGCPSSHGSSV